MPCSHCLVRVQQQQILILVLKCWSEEMGLFVVVVALGWFFRLVFLFFFWSGLFWFFCLVGPWLLHFWRTAFSVHLLGPLKKILPLQYAFSIHFKTPLLGIRKEFYAFFSQSRVLAEQMHLPPAMAVH